MLQLFDTFINLLIFAFVGLLIWLYFNEPDSSDRIDEKRRS